MKRYTTPEVSVRRNALRTSLLAGSGDKPTDDKSGAPNAPEYDDWFGARQRLNFSEFI